MSLDQIILWFVAIGFVLGGTLGIGTVIALTLYGPGLQFFLPVAGAIASRLRLPVHAV